MPSRGQRRTALSIAAVVVAGLAAGIAQARRAEQAGSVLGSGHGLDLRRNGEGVVGLSIEVRDFEAARSTVQASTREALEPYVGAFGKAVLVRPEFTHCVWMELVQPASTGPAATRARRGTSTAQRD